MLVKRFRGRVVQRMSRIGDNIELVFPSEYAGGPRERFIVTQEDWDRYGSEDYEEGKSLRDFRTSAATGHAA